MKRYGRVIGIVIGLVLLAVLAFYIAPKISSMLTAKTNDSTVAPVVTKDEGVAMFESFLSDLDSAPQFTFCAVKSITGVTSSFSDVLYCTVRENDYVIQVEKDKKVYRQIYKGGEYTLVNDTDKTIYKNIQKIGFPDTHFQEALTGKVIGTHGEIINGNQAICIELYKNGTVYAFYFNQLGDLVRYYYIFDNNEITVDFCGFTMGLDDGISFDVPSSYKQDDDYPSI